MSGLCKITIVGNLGRDPEKRYAQSGNASTNFSVAATTRKKVQGEWTDVTTWFAVTVFGALGERLADRLSKGSRVYVEGRLESRLYEGKNGTQVSLDVIANDVLDLSPRQQGADSPAPTQRPAADDFDEIPF